MLLAEEDRLSKQPRPYASHTHTASSSNVLLAADESVPVAATQPYHNINNRGNYGKNRNNNNRGDGCGNRGIERHNGNTNTFSPGYGYPPWTYGPPQWSYPHYLGGHPMITAAPTYPPFVTPPTHRPNNILGPYSPRPSPQAHVTHDASTDATSTVIPSALAHAFNTMSLHDPANSSWYMHGYRSHQPHYGSTRYPLFHF